MKRKLEDKIAHARDMKDSAVKFWLISASISGIILISGFLLNETHLIGTAYGSFMIFSIAAIAWFTIYSDHEEDLMKELEKQNLEERIEKLEQSF